MMTTREHTPSAGFRGEIHAAFAIQGRGTFVAVGLDFAGRVSIGDLVSVPLRDGSRRVLTVLGVEHIDRISEHTASLGLGFGEAIAPASVDTAGWVTATASVTHD